MVSHTRVANRRTIPGLSLVCSEALCFWRYNSLVQSGSFSDCCFILLLSLTFLCLPSFSLSAPTVRVDASYLFLTLISCGTPQRQTPSHRKHRTKSKPRCSVQVLHQATGKGVCLGVWFFQKQCFSCVCALCSFWGFT